MSPPTDNIPSPRKRADFPQVFRHERTWANRLRETSRIPEGSPTLCDIEMSYIQAVLEKHNGNKPAASKELGISLKTLYNKINQLQQN